MDPGHLLLWIVEEGHTGFLHLPFAVLALIFIAIQRSDLPGLMAIATTCSAPSFFRVLSFFESRLLSI